MRKPFTKHHPEQSTRWSLQLSYQMAPKGHTHDTQTSHSYTLMHTVACCTALFSTPPCIFKELKPSLFS